MLDSASRQSVTNLLYCHVAEAQKVMASVKVKRTHLSLEKKIEVIKYARNHPGTSVRAIAEAIGSIGKTQVSEILKKKDTILSAYESNASTSKKCRVSKFADVNEALYDWYKMACSKSIYPSGPQLTAKAKLAWASLLKGAVAGSADGKLDIM